MLETKIYQMHFRLSRNVATMQLCDNAQMQQYTDEYNSKINECTFGALCIVATMRLYNGTLVQQCT